MFLFIDGIEPWYTGNFWPENKNIFEAGRRKTERVLESANVNKSDALDFKNYFNIEFSWSCICENSFEKVKTGKWFKEIKITE